MKVVALLLAFLFGSISALEPSQAMVRGGLTGPSAPATCSAGVLDTFAASPGAWTASYSMRLTRTGYTSSNGALTLQRSSDSTTLNVGFSGCDPNTTPTTSFCSTQTLAVGTTSSTRVAFPTGSVIHVFNEGPSPIFYAAGNSSVTATVASTPLVFNQGVNITVGANTNIAAIIGSGYGINGGTGSATLFLTNCGASAVYDQSGNINDMAPISAGLVNQMGYLPNYNGTGLPVLFGCLSGCGLKATDSASYKTTTVETFTVMTFGEDITTSPFFYNGIGYPTTTSSNAQDFRWGLTNSADPDVLINNINGSIGANAEGFGGIWRGQNLTQFDYSTGGSTRWNGGTQFLNTGSATPTYPNAVGLYLMGDAAGNGTPGIFAESLVASGTQTARNSISANQVSYFGITSGTAATVALTNPLSDGWNWNQVQLGGFAPNPPGPGKFTVNGNAFASEGAWNNYSQWQATNGSTASGQLGDLYRFQMTWPDGWDGTNRSEVDGSGGTAQFNTNTTFWVSYAVYIEPGTAVDTSWRIHGQMHGTGGNNCCVFNIKSATASTSDTWSIETDNTVSGSATIQYSVALTRGRWYHFVFQVLVSNSGTGDTFNAWLDPVTDGTMTQVVSLTGATLFGGNSLSPANYWKYGIYQTLGAILPAMAVRYGNMQVCSTGTDCTTKYGSSDLSARTTAPLADPAHL